MFGCGDFGGVLGDCARGRVFRGEKFFAPTNHGIIVVHAIRWGDEEYAVYVVGHDDKCIKDHVREMVGDRQPTGLRRFAYIVQMRGSGTDIGFMPTGATGNCLRRLFLIPSLLLLNIIYGLIGTCDSTRFLPPPFDHIQSLCC